MASTENSNRYPIAPLRRYLNLVETFACLYNLPDYGERLIRPMMTEGELSYSEFLYTIYSLAASDWDMQEDDDPEYIRLAKAVADADHASEAEEALEAYRQASILRLLQTAGIEDVAGIMENNPAGFRILCRDGADSLISSEHAGRVWKEDRLLIRVNCPRKVTA